MTSTSTVGRSPTLNGNKSAVAIEGLSNAWALHPRVSLRPEPFGALAYHYDNRKLQFLRSPDLVQLVRSLSDHGSPRQAFDAQGLDPKRWPAFEKALLALAGSSFIQPANTPSEHESISEQLDE